MPTGPTGDDFVGSHEEFGVDLGQLGVTDVSWNGCSCHQRSTVAISKCFQKTERLSCASLAHADEQSFGGSSRPWQLQLPNTKHRTQSIHHSIEPHFMH